MAAVPQCESPKQYDKSSADGKVSVCIKREVSMKYSKMSIFKYLKFSIVQCRIKKAKQERLRVIDVDGSQLERKRQRLQLSDSSICIPPLPLPPDPPSGWRSVSQLNVSTMAQYIPHVTPVTLYSYLAVTECSRY